MISLTVRCATAVLEARLAAVNRYLAAAGRATVVARPGLGPDEAFLTMDEVEIIIDYQALQSLVIEGRGGVHITGQGDIICRAYLRFSEAMIIEVEDIQYSGRWLVAGQWV